MTARWVRRVPTAGALLALALLVDTVIRGRPSALAVALGKPQALILAAVACLFAAHALRARPWASRRSAAEFVGRWAILGTSAAVSLLLGEFAVRRYLEARQARGGLEDLQRAGGELTVEGGFTPLAAIVRLTDSPRLVYELKPDLDMEFGHRRLITNAGGMRESTNYPAAKAEGAFRIVGIGDSGMFGWGVHQGEDYLSRLEERLSRRAPPRIEVINLAVPGYNTQQEVDRLRARGLAYRPDVVIVGWCDNDADPPFLVARHRDYRTLRRSFLYALLFYRRETLTPVVSKAADLEKASIDPAILEYTGPAGVERALAELKELGREHGFKVLVFGPMHREAVGFCRHTGVPYYNTKEQIPRDRYPPQYEVHFMHPRAGGHAVLAEHLEAELDRLGWLPPAPAGAAAAPPAPATAP